MYVRMNGFLHKHNLINLLQARVVLCGHSAGAHLVSLAVLSLMQLSAPASMDPASPLLQHLRTGLGPDHTPRDLLHSIVYAASTHACIAVLIPL